MATSGQTLNDRINACRYALAGQGLARCVCKATTEEVIGPKKKHLDYIVACTHEPNVSIPQLANLLIERTNHIYWVVVFKALVTVHHLMRYGNERFIQYLASSNYSFELSTFLDKTTTRDFSMSNFIRRYSRYINEKALSYRSLAFDLCKVKRGSDGILRNMPIERLLRTLPILQNQLDALLEFDCMANDLNNGVINAAFVLLFKDLIGLYACHNDGIINLLKKYFTLNRKMCREAFDLYKKYLVRVDKVSDFLKVAEQVGIDKDEIPSESKRANSLLEEMEKHLQNLETNRRTLKNQTSSNELGSNAITSFKSTNSSEADDYGLNSIKDDEVRKALEEEARVLSQYGTESKVKSSSDSLSQSSLTTHSAVTVPKMIDDIFGDPDSFGNVNNMSSNNNNSSVAKSRSSGFAFDSLSTTSSSSDNNKSKVDSLKSAIQSATDALESSTTNVTNKKPSHDLLGLLDAPSSQPVVNNAITIPKLLPASTNLKLSSPFESNLNDNFPKLQHPGRILPPPSTTHSQHNKTANNTATVLKPGNPFPDISGTTCEVFHPTVSTLVSSTHQQQSTSNSQHIQQQSMGMTNFSDVLLPTSTSGLKPLTTGGENIKRQTTGNKVTGPALFTGDLDSTLANLAQNLLLEGAGAGGGMARGKS